MLLLIVFAFIAGVVTILSPCILPILPIILSSTVDSSGKKHPLGIVSGFVASFTFFTLFLSSLVTLTKIPADSLRFTSIIILALFGFSLLIPQFQLLLEQLFSRFTSVAPRFQTHTGFIGGLFIGFSLGLLWTPCVGPILASVISLALSGTVTLQALFITLAYSIGTAIPMLIIMLTGNTVLQKLPWLLRNTATIQKTFGFMMIITSIGIYFNIDRRFQTFILSTFPNYGIGLTKFEDNQQVKNQLKKIYNNTSNQQIIGKPMSDITKPNGPAAPELIKGGDWFNSTPLALSDLRGKVVLIDFWTYSCINCQRTFPYLRTWWDKYQNQGLVIIGVHSPEFEFEKSADNLQQAITDFQLQYPIMQDNDFATWRAYHNRYWPAKYIIDKDGYVRYSHFGEGKYDQTEQVIQQLLQETGTTVSQSISNPRYTINSRTPELYLGYLRIEHFSSPQAVNKDNLATYSLPSPLPRNTFAYHGQWTITPEFSSPSAGAILELSFDAQQVYLVARPQSNPGSFKVFLDNQPQFLGDDVSNGTVKVNTDRLYQLINLDTPGRHFLRLEFLDSYLELYAFTFG